MRRRMRTRMRRRRVVLITSKEYVPSMRGERFLQHSFVALPPKHLSTSAAQ
jgi:hypothetical protein